MKSRAAQNKGSMKRANQTAGFLSKMSSILSIVSILGADTDEQINWFQNKGLIARTKNCPACTQAMTLQQRSDVTDQYR